MCLTRFRSKLQWRGPKLSVLNLCQVHHPCPVISVRGVFSFFLRSFSAVFAELLHEGGGEERYLSYLKTVCAQLTAGTEMPYPSEGYGQTSQVLSQISVLQNDETSAGCCNAHRDACQPMPICMIVQEKMGKGKGVSLSQCVAACNDHSLCTGFSYAKELKQCLLRAGDVQAKAIASIAGVCLSVTQLSFCALCCVLCVCARAL